MLFSNWCFLELKAKLIIKQHKQTILPMVLTVLPVVLTTKNMTALFKELRLDKMVEFTLWHAMKVQKGNTGKAVLFL